MLGQLSPLKRGSGPEDRGGSHSLNTQLPNEIGIAKNAVASANGLQVQPLLQNQLQNTKHCPLTEGD